MCVCVCCVCVCVCVCLCVNERARVSCRECVRVCVRTECVQASLSPGVRVFFPFFFSQYHSVSFTLLCMTK